MLKYYRPEDEEKYKILKMHFKNEIKNLDKPKKNNDHNILLNVFKYIIVLGIIMNIFIWLRL